MNLFGCVRMTVGLAPHAVNIPAMWNDDARRLAQAIALHLADRPEPDWSIAGASPAAKVIDCVLSLRKHYDSVVLPRVRRFQEEHGGVRSMRELITLIDTVGGASAFVRDVLRMNSPVKGTAILGVGHYLDDMQARFDGDDESARLKAWADWARPGDHLALDVRGFGLAGFQYLRMLFGAETAKPDVHVIRFVSHALGRTVSDVQALYILERAAEISGQSLRRLDNLIWEAGAKRNERQSST